MPFSVFKQQEIQAGLNRVYNGDQNLGQRLGRIDVRCVFEAERFKWAINNGSLDALFFFHFDFHQEIPFEWAKVEIDLGPSSDAISPLTTVKDWAPRKGITGPPNNMSIQKRHAINPEVEGGFGGGTATLRGLSIEKSVDMVERHRWFFKASVPSGPCNMIEKAEFRWDSDGDHISSRRSYIGALVANREGSNPGSGAPVPSAFKLRVRVKVFPCRWWEQLRRSASQSKESDPIRLLETRKLETVEFERQAKQLQDEILRRNEAEAIVQVAETRRIVGPRLVGDFSSNALNPDLAPEVGTPA